jgi:uncharacterized protein (DUF433 family)
VAVLAWAWPLANLPPQRYAPGVVEYVERNEQGTLRIAGTRVSIASVVHAYWNGDSPEEIAQNFPSLSLEQVHGSLAYYLAHRAEIDNELEQLEEQWNELRSAAQKQNRELREKLARARNARAAS